VIEEIERVDPAGADLDLLDSAERREPAEAALRREPYVQSPLAPEVSAVLARPGMEPPRARRLRDSGWV